MRSHLPSMLKYLLAGQRTVTICKRFERHLQRHFERHAQRHFAFSASARCAVTLE